MKKIVFGILMGFLILFALVVQIIGISRFIDALSVKTVVPAIILALIFYISHLKNELEER